MISLTLGCVERIWRIGVGTELGMNFADLVDSWWSVPWNIVAGSYTEGNEGLDAC